MSSSSVPILRAGFGLEHDRRDAITNHMLAVLMSCFAEVFRSAYTVTHLYTTHQLLAMRSSSVEGLQQMDSIAIESFVNTATWQAVLEENVTLDRLLRGLHHQTSHTNGAVQQIKPFYAYIAQNHAMPTDASELMSHAWLERIMAHYDGALICVRDAPQFEAKMSRLLVESLTTGRTLTDIVRAEQSETNAAATSSNDNNSAQVESDDCASVGMVSNESNDSDSSINETDSEDNNGVCQCEFCSSVDASHAAWEEWIPADEFDSKMINLINDIESALLRCVEEEEQVDDLSNE